MYPEYCDQMATERRESFPAAWIVGENLLYLSMWVLAGALVWPIRWYGWPVVTIAWAALVVVLQVLLKKHICSGCYYYGKNCHLGWGRLSAWLFRQNSGDVETGMRLALFYIVSPPIFLLAGILVGLFLDVGMWHWTALGAYVALNAMSFPVRNKGCSSCAMRLVCPGSAAKVAPQGQAGSR